MQQGAANPAVIAGIDRGGFVESWHSGMALFMDAGGAVVEAHGPIDARPFLSRSALKPLYAAAMLRAGVAPSSTEQLALACASNASQAVHVGLAREMARDYGVAESDLRCAPTKPAEGGEPTRFAHQCVGKHLFLASLAKGTGDADYTSPEHPLTALLRDAVTEVTGAAPGVTVADGCSAPVFDTTMLGLATIYRSLRVPTEVELSPWLLQAGAAMREHPVIIEGEGGFDTRVAEEYGVVSKFGAEGTLAVVADDGAVAVAHCFDGARRGAIIPVLDMLARHGYADADALEKVGGGDKLTGRGAQAVAFPAIH